MFEEIALAGFYKNKFLPILIEHFLGHPIDLIIVLKNKKNKFQKKIQK